MYPSITKGLQRRLPVPGGAKLRSGKPNKRSGQHGRVEQSREGCGGISVTAGEDAHSSTKLICRLFHCQGGLGQQKYLVGLEVGAEMESDGYVSPEGFSVLARDS